MWQTTSGAAFGTSPSNPEDHVHFLVSPRQRRNGLLSNAGLNDADTGVHRPDPHAIGPAAGARIKEKRLGDEDGIDSSSKGRRALVLQAEQTKTKVRREEVRGFGAGQCLFGVFSSHVPTIPAAPTAAVVIVPDLRQGANSWDDLAAQLVDAGFAVLAYEHRGFGRSGSYGGPGRGQVPDWVSMDRPSVASDLRDAVLTAKQLSGCSQAFVVAQGLGALGAALLATSPGVAAAAHNTSEAAAAVCGFVFSDPSLLAEHQEPLICSVPTMVRSPPRSSSSPERRHFNFSATSPDSTPSSASPLSAKGSASALEDAFAVLHDRMGALNAPTLLFRSASGSSRQQQGVADSCAVVVQAAAAMAAAAAAARATIPAVTLLSSEMTAEDLIWWIGRQQKQQQMQRCD